MKTIARTASGVSDASRTTLVAAFGLLALSLPTLSMAQSNSPWLPIPSSGAVGLSYVTQRADTAYIGDKNMPISAITGGAAQRYNNDSYALNFLYGVSDSVSVDARIGGASVEIGAADKSSGQSDSVIGVNWRVLDEYESRGLPTVTLRLTGILSGGYDGARLASLGKAASGHSLSVLVGKQINPAVRLWAGLGTESRSNGVPDATFIDLNAAYAITPQLAASLGYTNKKFGGNLDIGGPGFSPAAFQQVREERETVRVGVSYAIGRNQSVAVNAGQVVNGRNTVKDDLVLGLSYSFGF